MTTTMTAAAATAYGNVAYMVLSDARATTSAVHAPFILYKHKYKHSHNAHLIVTVIECSMELDTKE